MLTIFLARHGQDQDNARGLLNGHRDEPLTENGLAQAQALAASIKAQDLLFDQIYSSPLQRALRTAQIISEHIDGPPPRVLPLLIERDFGTMSGRPYQEVVTACAHCLFPTETISYFLEAPGAETFPELHARGATILQIIQADHADGTILLVAHGDIGKMIFAAYYGLSWEEALRHFQFGNSDLIELSEQATRDTAHVFKNTQYNQ